MKKPPKKSEGEEKMDFETFPDIIGFAIQREEEAIKAYGELMEMSQAPGLKKLLSELQEEERKHRELLQELTEKKLESLKAEKIIDLKISDYTLEEPAGKDMNFQDLLIFAAQKEQKAVELYSSLRDKTRDKDIRKLFDFLVMQEKSHKLRLEKEYETHVLEGY